MNESTHFDELMAASSLGTEESKAYQRQATTIVDADSVSDALLLLNDLDLDEGDDADMVARVLDRMSFEQIKTLAVRMDALAALVDDIVYALGAMPLDVMPEHGPRGDIHPDDVKPDGSLR